MFILFFLVSINSIGQDCDRFNRWAECRPRINDYTIYLQPKSIAIGINDTLTFNVVFEGNRDYILSFCANKLYSPIHVKLLNLGTRKLIYDNATDDYPESIGIGFYKTQTIIVKISLMADLLGDEKLDRYDIVCVGMIMHWRKISSK